MEDAVKAMALGLLQRGKKVRIIVDALGSLNQGEAQLAVRKMAAKGAKLCHTRDLAGISHLKYIQTCDHQGYARAIRQKLTRVGKINIYPQNIQNNIITSNLL